MHSDSRSREEDIGLLEIDPEGVFSQDQRQYERKQSQYPSARSLAQVIPILIRRLATLKWYDLFRRFLWFLVPSFFQGPEWRAQIRPKELRPTAYLDGIRGIAALAVYFFNTVLQVYNPWSGFGRDGSHYNIMRLPYLRLLYDGHAAVSIFFVISGYVLSYRLLKLAREGKFDDFSTTISSLTFRRFMRLYLPLFASTFAIFCLVRLGAYEASRYFAVNKLYSPNYQEGPTQRFKYISTQFVNWLQMLWSLINVFSWERVANLKYDPHLWTTPIEFRCSLFIFVVILGTARLRAMWRFAILAVCALFAHQHARWDCLHFIAGMAIAELDLVQGIHRSKSDQRRNFKVSQNVTYFWMFICIVGLYLLGQPAGTRETPGWVWLGRAMPDWGRETHRYWRTYGASMVILAVGRLPECHEFLNSSIMQYLGRISYSLYLTHSLAMHTFTYHLQSFAYSLTGIMRNNHNLGFMLGLCLSTPVIIWVADVFWRAVDIPTLAFATWLENKLAVKQA